LSRVLSDVHSISFTRLSLYRLSSSLFFFFTAPPPPELYTLSLHDALPISSSSTRTRWGALRARSLSVPFRIPHSAFRTRVQSRSTRNDARGGGTMVAPR